MFIMMVMAMLGFIMIGFILHHHRRKKSKQIPKQSVFITRVHKADGTVQEFRATDDTGDMLEAKPNHNGDLVISRWNLGDPLEIRHAEAVFASGQWTRTEEEIQQ
jgi:hypothetical protein